MLITGGAGSIGLHLARRLLREGFEVTLLDNFQRAERDAELTAVLADPAVTMLDTNLAETPDVGFGYTHIYHLAAILGVQNVLQDPFSVLERNVALTLSALEIGRRQHALERFVFASTSEVYAGTLEHHGLPIPTPENTPITLPALDRPRTTYMLSKLYGEALCLQSGLPVTIIRPHNVYGPRMGRAHVIPELLDRAHHLAGQSTFEVFSVDHTRTFCFVEDAVEMILLLSTLDTGKGRIVNIGTQTPEITMGDLAGRILAAVNKEAVIEARPPAPGSPERRAPDMTLCHELTGYSSRIGLKEGITRTYAWYRESFDED